KTASKGLVSIVTPDVTDVQGMIETIERYGEERQVAKAWAESFTPVAHAHFEAAESYEKAQLAAEIGIVVASIALLIGNRIFWVLSLAAGLLGFGVIGTTLTHLSSALTKKCDPSSAIVWTVPEHHHAVDASNGCVPGAEQRKEHAEEE